MLTHDMVPVWHVNHSSLRIYPLSNMDLQYYQYSKSLFADGLVKRLRFLEVINLISRKYN